MKKLLISSVVAVLCMGASVVYADDTHHPEQGSAPAFKSSPGKSDGIWECYYPKGSEGDSGVADAQMGQGTRAHETVTGTHG